MKNQYKKSFFLASLLLCTQLKAPAEFGLESKTLETLQNLSVTIQPQLPTVSIRSMGNALFFCGALVGLRLVHTGINLATEPNNTYTPEQQNAAYKRGIIRSVLGLLLLSGSGTALYTLSK